MGQYLLAAEADKIQDLIFRSSHLREVVGGSQLLERFCAEATPALLDHFQAHKPEVVINAGGAIRIIFHSATEAQVNEFGRLLAETYARTLGGHLTVAVVDVEAQGEPAGAAGESPGLLERADRALRRAKEARGGAEAIPHLPQVAFCASCGVALADRYAPGIRPDRPQDANYLCSSCAAKASEREQNRRQLLGLLEEEMRRQQPGLPPRLSWPDAEALKQFDGKGYVAYLVADGNDLGLQFSRCDPAAAGQLSTRLREAVVRSLATPAVQLWRWTSRMARNRADLSPVLPLIMAGDDVFALLPAPWALDFARQFALEFEKLETPAGAGATAAVGVVICKASYPYALAHRQALRLMAKAKALGKQLAARRGARLSSVNWRVIKSNRLGDAEMASGTQRIKATMRPYWAVASLPPEAAGMGVDLDTLLKWRLALRGVRAGRLAQIEALYGDHPQMASLAGDRSPLDNWNKRLDALLGRIGHGEAGMEARRALEGALAELGYDPAQEQTLKALLPELSQTALGQWRPLERDGEVYLAHGLPDLLDAWDYAWRLAEDPAAYTRGEESR